MKARLGARGWLAAVLLLAYGVQPAVATAHLPLPSVAGVGHQKAAGGEAGEQHDPASCALCQVVSQLRGQGLSAPALCLPLTKETTQPVADAPPVPQAQVSLRGPTSRAPPCSPTA